MKRYQEKDIKAKEAEKKSPYNVLVSPSSADLYDDLQPERDAPSVLIWESDILIMDYAMTLLDEEDRKNYRPSSLRICDDGHGVRVNFVKRKYIMS